MVAYRLEGDAYRQEVRLEPGRIAELDMGSASLRFDPDELLT